jgi:NhaA family Na+:H+ antiporter
MVAPALLYLYFAGGPATHSGWGVPMATDIAFAVGILTLLGSRVPAALRVLLLALAVIDDLGAIVVIAFFYSSGVKLAGLAVAAAGIAGIFALSASGVRLKLAYVAPAAVVWGGVYAAGIHPTIAGVVVGLLTPVRAWLGPDGFTREVRRELDRLDSSPAGSEVHHLSETLQRVDAARREALSPAASAITALHPWVAFAIMPVFALANAGVSLSGVSLDTSSTMAALGVAVGLLVGKPIGILLACLAALRLRVATLPSGIGARHLTVLGVVAGIGFTMALFIAQLAFSDRALLAAAKLGVLAASAVAALAGLSLGAALLRPRGRATGQPEPSADGAERSPAP